MPFTAVLRARLAVIDSDRWLAWASVCPALLVNADKPFSRTLALGSYNDAGSCAASSSPTLLADLRSCAR